MWAALLRVISHSVRTVHRPFQNEGILRSQGCGLIKIRSSLLRPLLAIYQIFFCAVQIDQSYLGVNIGFGEPLISVQNGLNGFVVATLLLEFHFRGRRVARSEERRVGKEGKVRG